VSDRHRSAGPGDRPGGDFDIDELGDRLLPLLDLIDASPVSLTSVRDRGDSIDRHLRDSLSGLAIPAVTEAERVVDIGSGAGFPGLPLAMALPETEFTLIDSVARKADFIGTAATELGLGNVTTLPVRSEELAAESGREAFDCVIARAVAPLSALAELASPLLVEGGHLVAWKGEREVEEEETLKKVGPGIAMELTEVVGTVPFPESRTRNLYLVSKTAPTPKNLPRRAGMARKRPLSA
jgi:16S rRNA (guanine527-N7)-methyltransferase